MAVFLLAGLSACVHVGIDLGTHFVKASIVETTDHPQVALNVEGQRLTPHFIAFRASPEFNIASPDPLVAEEADQLTPMIGRKALDVMTHRPWAGTGFLPLFLDQTPEGADLLAKTLFVNTSAARMPVTDLPTTFLTLFLDSVVNGKTITSITVALPATFTIPQRRLVEGAVRRSGVKYLTIDDVDAVANNYAVRKSQKFSNESRTVLFVDVGAASVKAYAIRFAMVLGLKGPTGQATAERLSYVIREHQGGAFLTAKLVPLLQKKLGIESPTKSDYRRLFDAAEKLKIQLTLAQTATLVIEDLAGDDRPATLTRDELDSISGELVADVIATAKSAASGLQIDELEVLGGCSRVPIINSSLPAALEFEAAGHSLNSDEAIVMGAGYHAQFEVGTSRYQRVLLNNSFPVPLTTLSAGNVSYPIVTDAHNFSETVTIPEKVETVTLEFPTTLRTSTFSYHISNMTDNATLELRFSRSPVDLQSARICVDGRFCSAAKFIPFEPIYAAPAAHVRLMKDEGTRKRQGRMRNEVEHLTLRVLDEVANNATIISFTSDLERFKLKTTAQDVKNWIQEHGNDASEKNLTARFTEVWDLVKPVYLRIYENKTLSYVIFKMHRTLLVGRMRTLDWLVNRTWINHTTVDNFTQLLTQMEHWLNETIWDWKDMPLWENRPVKAQEFDNRTQVIMEELKRIEAILPETKPAATSKVSKAFSWVRKLWPFGKKRKTASKSSKTAKGKETVEKGKPKPPGGKANPKGSEPKNDL
jgi:molecular chaperone DnaK (HSP70)